MLSWLRKNGPAVAVDIDGRRARLVLAELVGQSVRIVRLAATELPADLDLSDAAAVGRALEPAITRLAGKQAALLMHVSRGQAVLKTISLPRSTTPADLAGMVRYQVEKELPFRPEEAVIDFTVESHFDPAAEAGAGGMSVLVGAIRVPVADFFRQLAVAAGCSLRRLSLRPYACLRTLQVCGLTHQHKRLAFVHVGADEAEIDVIADDALAFSRSAPSRIGNGTSERDAVAALVTEVLRSLQSYQSVQGSGKIEAVFVSGGTGIEAAVAQELHARLTLPCRVLNPAQAMSLLDDGTAGAFVPALGLAAAMAGDARLPFDFANPKRPPVRRDVKRIRRQAVVAAVVVALVGIVVGRTLWLGGKDDEVAALTVQRNKLADENKKVAALVKEVDYLKRWQASNRKWLDHVANLSLLMPPAEDVYISKLRTEGDVNLAFTLRAKSDNVVSDLACRLTTAGYSFRRGTETTPRDPLGYTFESEATVSLVSQVKVDLAATRPCRPEDDASADPNYRPPQGGPRQGQPGQPGQPNQGGQPNAGNQPGRVVDLDRPQPGASPNDPRRRPRGERGDRGREGRP